MKYYVISNGTNRAYIESEVVPDEPIITELTKAEYEAAIAEIREANREG